MNWLLVDNLAIDRIVQASGKAEKDKKGCKAAIMLFEKEGIAALLC